MPSITETAHAFFAACESGKGWAVCQQYCSPDATFAAQAEPVADIRTLAGYCDWLAGLIGGPLPNAGYEIKSFDTDTERNCVLGFGVFTATHTGEGGPCPPTGKSTRADYVYAMEFAGGKIRHMTKIWNAGWTVRELGWG